MRQQIWTISGEIIFKLAKQIAKISAILCHDLWVNAVRYVCNLSYYLVNKTEFL